jgi:hypothetical protein
MKSHVVTLCAVTLVAAVAGTARAVPTTLTYAGVLTDSGARVEGSHDVLFELFDDDTAGTVRYSENIAGLIIIDGELIAELGNNNLDDTILELPELWLEVTVDGTPLSPRVRLNSVPYALRAQAAQQAIEAVLAEEALSLGGILPEDVVTSAQLAAQLASLGLSGGLSAGTGINITSGTVSIAPGGVGSTQLGAAAVTTGAIADLAVTSTKLANGAVTSTQLAPNAVTSNAIADNAVSDSEIADGTVKNAELSIDAVATINIANGAVTGGKIANATITTTQIASNAIALAQLQSNSVDGTKIVTGSVTGSDIADDSITSIDLADDSVGAPQIAANQVTSEEIANGTITEIDIRGGARNIFLTANGCEVGGLSTFSTCSTAFCAIVSGTARFFDCSRSCNQTSSQVCTNTDVGFILNPTLNP